MLRHCMKTIVGVAGIVLSLAISVSTFAQEEKEANISKFMRAKLGHSQKLIEALALEDYEQLAKNAQATSLLTQAEIWQVLQTPEYLQHSTEFRRAADALTEAAKKKNLDGAALAYVDMTLKCVNCHKYVRRAKMAANERNLPPIALIPTSTPSPLPRSKP